MPSKILVVDDDAHIRDVVQFALEKAGLEVIEAGDGRRAL
jgi:two-component system OmpR family response regulator